MDVREAHLHDPSMRRVTSEPIPMDAQARILEPPARSSGGNTQNSRFLLVDSPEVKAGIGSLYRQAIATLWSSSLQGACYAAAATPTTPSRCRSSR